MTEPEPTREITHKIGLGTAQFGMRYGIANRRGQPALDDVAATLDHAAAHGIRVLDTAPAYGESEQRLGELLGERCRFSIVTKTPAELSAQNADGARRQLAQGLRESLARLRVPTVYGLLAHRPEHLLGKWGEALFEEMRHLRDDGLTRRIGASVYTTQQAEAILDRHPIDLIQLPLSILDQRMLSSGALARLRAAGVEVHARSSLLQGVLTMDPAALPEALEGLREPLRRLRESVALRGLSMLDAAIGFAVGLAEVDVVVCGVEGPDQLDQLVRAATQRVDPDWFRDFARSDPALIDPSRWPEAS